MKYTLLFLSFGLFTFLGSLFPTQTTAKTGSSNASSGAKIRSASVLNAQTITSAFSPKEHCWDIAWPGRVSQYDLV